LALFPASNGSSPVSVPAPAALVAPPVAPAPSGQDSTGVMPGQQAALNSYLRNFSPGDVGIAGLANDMLLTLPVPEWQWSSIYLEDNATPYTPASTAQDVNFYEVPTDRRAKLLGMNVQVAAGDNQVDRLYIIYPYAYGYGAGGNSMIPIRLAAGQTSVWWPDNSGVQTWSDFFMPSVGPLLLEPGTKLSFRTNGAGVAQTIFSYQLTLLLSPLVRERTL